jgi:hypothetical protein
MYENTLDRVLKICYNQYINFQISFKNKKIKQKYEKGNDEKTFLD